MLIGALDQLIEYARLHQARYRLLLSDENLSPSQGLVDAAFASFQAFRLLVSRYQLQVGQIGLDEVELAGLIYATCHGAIDLQLSGRATGSKGLVIQALGYCPYFQQRAEPTQAGTTGWRQVLRTANRVAPEQ